ncbi:hypothetical protein D3C87_2072210 [compost metagenome]
MPESVWLPLTSSRYDHLSSSAPPLPKPNRWVSCVPSVVISSFSMGPRLGFFGITLTTPPMAPSPYSTEAGPRSTSMRSTAQGS